MALATLFVNESHEPFGKSVDAPVGDAFSAPPASPAELIARLPKVWVGYLLAFATLAGEGIAVARNPALGKGGEIGIPPLEIYLPAFVAGVYWLVCVHRYHLVLAHVPGWKHPISPARAVWFHFIPFFVVYWVFRWPGAIADFVNQRLQAPVMKKWIVGVMFFTSLLCRVFVDPSLSIVILFFSCTYVSGFLQRALATPIAGEA